MGFWKWLSVGPVTYDDEDGSMWQGGKLIGMDPAWRAKKLRKE